MIQTRSISKRKLEDNPQTDLPLAKKTNNKNNTMPETSLEQILEFMKKIESGQRDMNDKIQANTDAMNNQATALENKIEETYTKVKNELHAEIKKLSDSVEQNMKNQINKMEEKIDQVTKQFNNELTSIRKNVSESMNAVEPTKNDDFDRLLIINDLKIVGIPYKDDENLLEIFMKIASFIGYDTSSPLAIPSFRRIISRSRIAGQLIYTKVIVCKFIAQHIKENFYGSYLNSIKSKTLTTELIGYTQGNRIIIGEQLTAKNQKIFQMAAAYKRSNNSIQVYTSNGLVNIRLQRGANSYTIRRERELEEFAASSNLNEPIFNLNKPDHMMNSNNTGSSTENSNMITE